MPTGPTALTREEIINLFILSMKADGLNQKLIADGTVGGESVIAAKKFFEHREQESTLSYSAPKDEITMAFLEKFVPNEKAEAGKTIHLLTPRERMEKFFAEHGIAL